MSSEIGLMLVVLTVAFFPLHEYWVRQAKHDYDETFRRRVFGEQMVTIIFWSWVVVVFIAAIGGSFN
jgi:hypothetical protein